MSQKGFFLDFGGINLIEMSLKALLEGFGVQSFRVPDATLFFVVVAGQGQWLMFCWCFVGLWSV